MKATIDLERGAQLCVPALMLGCTMINPAFDGEIDDGEQAETQTVATDSSGDGDPGDGDGDPGDGDGDPGDGDGDPGDGDGDEPCMMTVCDGMCVDTNVDNQHCGDCGVPCEGTVCIDGDCKPKRYVFVTSMRMGGNFGGRSGANELCQQAAWAGQLPQANYIAWLSEANEMFDTSGEGAFVRKDGMIVAKSWMDLLDGQIDVPINLTEFGDMVEPAGECSFETAVWSGIETNGTPIGPSCDSWTSTEVNGQVGDANATDGDWTAAPCAAQCSMMLPIYCIAG